LHEEYVYVVCKIGSINENGIIKLNFERLFFKIMHYQVDKFGKFRGGVNCEAVKKNFIL
jgi:hypothetical protein